jgi:hypothetical protein
MQVVTEQAMQRAMVRINSRKYGTRRDRALKLLHGRPSAGL